MAANPCADQIPASVSSSFTSSGFGSAGSTQNQPSATKTQQKNGELWKQQQQQQHCINAGLEQDELELERLASCCWGRLDSRLSLQLLVLLNFLLDGVSAWLSLEHMFASYLFAGAALLSLLSVCAVLNGLQEEKKTMVKGTAMLAGIKAVVLSALTLTAVAAFVEEQSTNEQFRPSLELRALLFCVLPLFVCSLSAQYRLSQRVVAWLRLKDQLYVISAPLGDYCQLRGRTLTTTTTMTTGRGSWKRRELNPSSREQMGGGVKC